MPILLRKNHNEWCYGKVGQNAANNFETLFLQSIYLDHFYSSTIFLFDIIILQKTNVDSLKI